jgi:hypothetical protein
MEESKEDMGDDDEKVGHASHEDFNNADPCGVVV